MLAEKEDSRSFKKKDHFRLLGVDYYYEGDPAVLAAWKKITRKYLLILESSGRDFSGNGLRCTKSHMVADLSEWKLEAFLGLLTEKGEVQKNGSV